MGARRRLVAADGDALHSLADPSAVGSGHTALTTLMHEAGHAAHFANIRQRSPLFSQERAPTSVAYAELQSMFLDSLVGDAAWRCRYAVSRSGEPLPFALHAEDVRAKHPYEVLALRGMLAVPYFEKALYEMDEDALSAAAVLELADAVEKDIQGGLGAGRSSRCRTSSRTRRRATTTATCSPRWPCTRRAPT